MLKKIFKFSGSLKFAVLLLSVLIAASIAGTIYETKFNADVAQKYIYGASWFNIWLTLLGINLFSAAAVRYPWKRHQTGFVITHAGIITLLIGAMIDRMYGVEGNVQLFSNRPATNVLELHKQILTVKVGDKKADTPLQTSTLWNEMPLNSPEPGMKVEIKDVEPVTTAEEAEAVKDGQPALSVSLQGSMMGRNDAALFMNQPLNLGPASLMFLPGRAKAPADSDAQAEAELNLNFQGKTFSFPKLSKGTKELPLEGLPEWKIFILGFFPNFRMDDNKQPTSLGDKLLNPAVAFDLIGPAVKGAKLTKPEGPHAGAPVPQDPEKLAPRQERFFVFAKGNQVMNSVHHGEATGAKPTLLVTGMDDADPLDKPNGVIFYLDGANQEITYLLKSRRSGSKIGKIELEKPVNVDWAPGAQFVVHEYLPSARSKVVFVPRPELKKGDMESSGNQGVKVVVTVGDESKSLWVGQTMYNNRFAQELTIAGKKVGFEFVNETQVLPFTVGLKKFDAKLREGETAPDPNDPNPSELSFSSFESILSFDGRQDTVWLKANSETAKQFGATVLNGAILRTDANELHFQTNGGEEITLKNDDIDRTEKLTQDIAMNFPTTYPVSLTGPFTGRCYKFSQAGHNAPRDWTYSGVQVLYAPGWLYEWIGCLGIIFGIFTMFYLRPYFNRAPAKAAAQINPVSSATKKVKDNPKKKLAAVES